MKKTILLVAIILISLGLKAQENKSEIHWMTFTEALAAQKKNPKKIMMDIYTNWCGPCKLMDKKTFTNKDLITYVNTNFYAVKFNGEGSGTIKYDGQTFKNLRYDPKKKFGRNSPHQLTDYLQIQGFPSILFFDVDGSLIAPLSGYRTAKQLELFLKLFKTDKFKEIKSEDAFIKYQKDFVYEFKKL